MENQDCSGNLLKWMMTADDDKSTEHYYAKTISCDKPSIISDNDFNSTAITGDELQTRMHPLEVNELTETQLFEMLSTSSSVKR